MDKGVRAILRALYEVVQSIHERVGRHPAEATKLEQVKAELEQPEEAKPKAAAAPELEPEPPEPHDAAPKKTRWR